VHKAGDAADDGGGTGCTHAILKQCSQVNPCYNSRALLQDGVYASCPTSKVLGKVKASNDLVLEEWEASKVRQRKLPEEAEAFGKCDESTAASAQRLEMQRRVEAWQNVPALS
jgi:hypothetical protein